MPLGYLLDEHLPRSIQDELARQRPALVVRRVGDPNAPALGTKDPEILTWCEREGLVLVTNNRRTMPGHLNDHLRQGRHIPGIFFVDVSMSVGDVADELVFIAEASLEDEHRDLIRFLPL